MNLFYLDKDPVEAAKMHCDRHVVKMIIEVAQMLSTAHRVLDGEMYTDLSKNGRRIKRWKLFENDDIVYKATHVNHPSSKWIRETLGNYLYAYKLFVALCDEFEYRYGKVHLTRTKLENILKKEPNRITHGPMTKVPQAMPEYCKKDDSIEAYRFYYLNEKTSMMNYTKREKPEWI
jgi:hypothetical protein